MRHFYAYLSRLKLINRWGLMRNTQKENDAEHSFQAAIIAHGIALIAVKRYQKAINPEHVMAMAVYHDAHEVITGDMPTPIKYHNSKLKKEFNALEGVASDMLLHMLPDDLKSDYLPYLLPDESSDEWQIVKAADRICAYIKCLEESKAGNQEFDKAAKTILDSITAIDLPEVKAFFATFVPSFSLSLDELNQ